MLKQTIKKHLINSRGSRIGSRVIVFESDDWGSIRIPSYEIRNQLLSKKLIRESDPFSKYDSLETAKDYYDLYEVFEKFRDKKGNTPVLTANVVMNNPDFGRIAAGNFEKYYSESFVDTYLKYPESEHAFDALKIGIKNRMIIPQFHGHEHLNVIRWMKLLKEGNERYHFAFVRNCFSIDEINTTNRRANLMAAYDYDSKEELDYIKASIENGLKQFEEVFGFKSKSTVAPCYVWDHAIEEVFAQNSVQTFQGSYQQNCPVHGRAFKKKYRYSGQTNNLEQQYLVRNALFEPSINSNVDWVSQCLESIEIAFKWGKPAIIGTHRINFTSRLDENVRMENLISMENLLSKILEKWPDIEFMDTTSLKELYYK